MAAETGLPVDDLYLRGASGGYVFAQCKTGLTMSSDPKSRFAGFIDQALSMVDRVGTLPRPDSAAQARTFDGERDRILLIVDGAASDPIRSDLGRVVTHLRSHQTLGAAADATWTNDELRVIDTVRALANYSRRARQLPDLSESSLLDFIRTIDVVTLDVMAGERDEARALDDLLSSHSLLTGTDPRTVWNFLITLGFGALGQRLVFDYPGLIRALQDAGIVLAADPSTEDDIRTLVEYTKQTLARLAEHEAVVFGGAPLTVARPQVSSLQQLFDGEAGVLLVGDPGVGKSGILSQFATQAQSQGADVLVISAEDLVAATLPELQSLLNVSHPIAEVLNVWPGTAPAFLCIDGLDADNTADASSAYLQLIDHVKRIGGRWRIVATVRSYDLKYSVRLKQLFYSSESRQPTSSDLDRIAHVDVSGLTDRELLGISAGSEALTALLGGAGPDFRELLSVPFNLFLASQLVLHYSHDEIRSAKTQLELLDLYWQWRVSGMSSGLQLRERVLHDVLVSMLAERSLLTSRPTPTDSGLERALVALLRDAVLREAVNRKFGTGLGVRFNHKLLFDYAVAVLLFRGGTADALAEHLSNDRALSLLCRQSIALHFRHLWESDRDLFWRVLVQVVGDQAIPVVGRLVGPMVLAEVSPSIDEVEPLLSGAISDDSRRQVFQLLLVPLRANTPASVAGPEAGPWLALAERLSSTRDPYSLWVVQVILAVATERTSTLTPDQRIHANSAGRNLLHWAIRDTNYQRGAILVSLETIARTYEIDRPASQAALQELFTPEHIALYGHEELSWLARELPDLISQAPDLVRATYSAAFGYADTRQDAVPLGTGRILSLTSTPRQNYDLVRHALVELLPRILSEQPSLGVALVNRSIGLLLDRDELIGGRRGDIETVSTGDATAQSWRIQADNSVMWDSSADFRFDHHEVMLDHFERYVRGEAADGTNIPDLTDRLREEVTLASLWRRVLRAGSAHPTTLGRALLSLATSPITLTLRDTMVEACALLGSVHHTGTEQERDKIEASLLALTGDERAERIRDRGLGLLDRNHLRVPESQAILASLDSAGGPPPNDPLIGPVTLTTGPYEESDWLAEQGVQIDAPAVGDLMQMWEPLKSIAQLNGPLPEDQVETITNVVDALYGRLRAGSTEADPRAISAAHGHLAMAARKLAESENLDCTTERGRLVRNVLLYEANADSPTTEPDTEEQFERFPSWGSPAARVDAAQGLLLLLLRSNCANEEVMATIDRLAGDNHPAVRLPIAVDAALVTRLSDERAWELMATRAATEENAAVLASLLGSIGRMRAFSVHRARQLAFNVLARTDKVRKEAIGLLVVLFVVDGDQEAQRYVEGTVLNPRSLSGQLSALYELPHRLRLIIDGALTSSRDDRSEIMARGFAVLKSITTLATHELRNIVAETPSVAWSQEDARAIASLADSAAHQLLFLSITEVSDKKPRNEDLLRQIQPQVFEIIDIFLPSLPARIAHSLVETLAAYLDIVPALVALRLAEVTAGASIDGYQQESMAADLVVDMVRRLLADQRELMTRDEVCLQAIIRILDLFVSAGWPRAYELLLSVNDAFE